MTIGQAASQKLIFIFTDIAFVLHHARWALRTDLENVLQDARGKRGGKPEIPRSSGQRPAASKKLSAVEVELAN